ncbi:uncharacterized protein LOC134746360 [Cydia strobilella]|uniref:uncharacterized protein LOC134746360 n=1 Tax=Cydia strobilella TaxID=1100964 RepID=UPI003006F0A8
MKMGKKINKTHETHLTISDKGKLQSEKGDFPSENNNSTHSVKKSKKKRKLDLNGSVVEDTPAQIKSEEIDESNTPADGEIKKKKKKKRGLNNKVLHEEVQNDTDNNLNADEVHIPKKNKVLKDVKLELDEVPEMESHKPQDSKKKKNKNISVNEVKNEGDIIPKIENIKTKKKNKAKRGAPSLNDEEAQVTEEDIDKFVDELDEEDNKQYEEWVKLLDARLSKKTKAE